MNEFWHIIVWGLSTLVILLGGLLGLIRWLGGGWAAHVNEAIKDLWEAIDNERQAREKRWAHLKEACANHGERLAHIEALVNGKNKAAKKEN